MHAILSSLLLLAASTGLTPTKLWFTPQQPLTVDVKPGGESTLVLTSFSGKVFSAAGAADLAADKTVNLRDVFREMSTPGTYVLYVVKRGAAKDLEQAPKDFIGTPLMINVREDTRRGSAPGPMVVRVEPLRYAVMRTAAGPITMAFYYDVAPNTADNFLRLSEEGFYDGLTFHRIVPGFVIQGGDPRCDDPDLTKRSTGSPGYTINAEFSSKPHKEGVLSMARNGDPAEGPDSPPRPEFANSGSSQFFVCLDYEATKALDGKYTAFGEVIDGMDAVKKIAAAPLDDPKAGRPRERQAIEKIEVKPVTAAENPYAKLFKPSLTDAAGK
jgi:cyclophilin family peptidyl-prolyl cis-trans isomerase